MPAAVFPVFLRLAGRRVVVVGGGAVGRRRAAAALAAGAAVRVVDPGQRPAGFAHPRAEWVAEPYRADHLTGAALVFAAATGVVNAAVVRDAAARGVLVNDAADPVRGDFTVPAVGRLGEVTVAVGTGGASPGLAGRVRDDMLAGLDPAISTWVGLLAELRPEVLAGVPDPAARRQVFAELADGAWLSRIREDGPDAVRAAMREAVRRAGP